MKKTTIALASVTLVAFLVAYQIKLKKRVVKETDSAPPIPFTMPAKSFMSPSHDEWAKLISGLEGIALLKYLLEDVVEPVLRRNPNYHRCNKLADNLGICMIVREFKSYVESNTPPNEARIRLFGETAYTLWLLTTKSNHEASVQRRVSEFFKGTDYFGPGETGFRQFEYELQVLSRLVEEGIQFEDSPGEGDPDLTILSGPLRVEIKLPMKNAVGSLEKGLKQLGVNGGCIIIGLDNVLTETDEDNLDDIVIDIAKKLYAKIEHRTNVFVMIEFYRDNIATSDVAWIGNVRSAATVTMMHALTGNVYEVNNLPEPLFGHTVLG
jgi:hypothetical protein